jgi:hypothetical protein
MSTRIGCLAVLVQGVTHAAAERHGGENAAEKQAIDRAIGDIDALALADPVDRAATATDVGKILQTMTGALAAARGQMLDTIAPPQTGYNLRELTTQLNLANAAGWVLFASLTAIAGIYALIINDPNFGRPEDFLFCLLWGFGLPTAGQGLSSLSPAVIGQSFGVTLTEARA